MAKSKLVEANEKIGGCVTEGFKKMSDGVVSGYKKIEDSVVNTYTKIEDKFVSEFIYKCKKNRITKFDKVMFLNIMNFT